MKRSKILMIRGIIGIVVGLLSLFLSFYLRTILDELYQARLQQGLTGPPLPMVGISLIIIAVIGLIFGGYYLIEFYHINKREKAGSSYHPLKKMND